MHLNILRKQIILIMKLIKIKLIKIEHLKLLIEELTFLKIMKT